MAYLFQNLDGEAKKAVESLGVKRHSYPTALKTLKRKFGNPNSLTTAFLNDMLNSSYVPSNDRQGTEESTSQRKDVCHLQIQTPCCLLPCLQV